MIPDTMFERTSIDQFVNQIEIVWKRNASRTPLHVWLHVVRHSALLAESIRRQTYGMAMQECAHILVWWMSFIARLQDCVRANDGVHVDGSLVFFLRRSATNLIWRKYPGVCPACVEVDMLPYKRKNVQTFRRLAQKVLKDRFRKSCVCFGRLDEVEKRHETNGLGARKEDLFNCIRSFADKTRQKRPKTLDQLEKLFHKIFHNNIIVTPIESVCFHFLEEVGEISTVLSQMYRVPRDELDVQWEKLDADAEELGDELADVFSWLCAMTFKIKKAIENSRQQLNYFVLRPIEEAPKISLLESLKSCYVWNQGVLSCYRCKRAPCRCDKGEHMYC